MATHKQGNDMAEADSESASGVMEVKYEFTPVLAEILSHLKASVMVTTYQAGKLLVLGTHQGQMKISFASFDQPMGLAVDRDRLAIGSRRQMHYMAANREVAATIAPAGMWDVCFVPRSTTCTGSIHGHDLAWGRDGLWVVNTLFSCLCNLHEEYSFVPRWQPRFITQLIDQDRCHLNGLAMDDGRPRFVTAMSETDTAAGWRPTKAHSGVIMDVATGETVARDFAMPHSPRMYRGQLWVLDSGRGALGTVDAATGHFETVTTFPGYTRGLSFHGQFAFVGLSRIRETSVFGGVPIAERRNELKCGVGVVDLTSGRTVAVFQFLSGVTEIFAVEVAPEATCPVVAGASTDTKEHEVWIVPQPGTTPRSGPREPWFASAGRHSATQPAPPVESNPAPSMSEADRLQARLDLNPNDAAGWITLGNLRQEQSRQEDALRCYERAIAVDPKSAPARQNLGYLLFNQGFPERAREIYQQLLQYDPSPMNRLLATSVLPITYESATELETWRSDQIESLKAMVTDRCVVDATNQLIPTAFFWAYQGRNDRDMMTLRGSMIRGDESPRARSSDVRKSGGRIRVGFISAYFRNHTIGRLNIGRIEKLDRRQFEVVVCSASHADDEFAERFRRSADRFAALSRDPGRARQTLLQQDLDIAFFTDVGMDALCSTLAFSRFADLQCTTWGHPDTTGSRTMDFFLSSELLETATADQHYSEKLIRMPLTGTYYERPVLNAAAPLTRNDLKLPEKGTLYACPQSLFKFHPDFDGVLKQILTDDPNGYLIMIEGRVPEWTRRLKTRWQRTFGSAFDRVVFLPSLSNDVFLQLLKLSDVILDPMHFGGGNSSYEAMAVGTPVVTLPGEFLRSRITLALYRKMAFTELVVTSPADYANLAVKLGTDRKYLAATKQRIDDTSAVLFEDPAEIRCLEQTLNSL